MVQAEIAVRTPLLQLLDAGCTPDSRPSVAPTILCYRVHAAIAVRTPLLQSLDTEFGPIGGSLERGFNVKFILQQGNYSVGYVVLFNRLSIQLRFVPLPGRIDYGFGQSPLFYRILFKPRKIRFPGFFH